MLNMAKSKLTKLSKMRQDDIVGSGVANCHSLAGACGSGTLCTNIMKRHEGRG